MSVLCSINYTERHFAMIFFLLSCQWLLWVCGNGDKKGTLLCLI